MTADRNRGFIREKLNKYICPAAYFLSCGTFFPTFFFAGINLDDYYPERVKFKSFDKGTFLYPFNSGRTLKLAVVAGADGTVESAEIYGRMSDTPEPGYAVFSAVVSDRDRTAVLCDEAGTAVRTDPFQHLLVRMTVAAFFRCGDERESRLCSAQEHIGGGAF